MQDFKLFAKCDLCKKRKVFVMKRRVGLPMGKLWATSRDFFCGSCADRVRDRIK